MRGNSPSWECLLPQQQLEPEEELCEGGSFTYPHPPVTDGRSVLRQPQDKQVHLVLPPAADTETEALHALLQLHREEVEVLRELTEAQTRRD